MITIYQTSNCWMADYSMHKKRREIQDACGTTHLPTAFTEKANGDEVARALQDSNPGEIINIQV